ncbi:MAG: TRAP transporter TatT component family protein [Sandaracinus sp.]
MARRPRGGLSVAIALSALALAGCWATRAPAWALASVGPRAVVPAAQVDVESVARGERSWRARADEGDVRDAIDAWSRALEASPTDAVLWARLGRAQLFLATTFVAPDPARRSEARDLYASAVESAERSLLARTPGIARPLRAGRPFVAILSAFEEADVPALYVRTLALARWARMAGGPVEAELRVELRASMSRCAELDRGFDGAGADRFLGEAWSTLPAYLGGDVLRARDHLAAAIALAPERADNHVAYALFVAVPLHDRAGYVAELQTAAGLAIDDDDDDAPENRAARERARALLTEVDARFGAR